MRIWYIANMRFPTEKAHGIQVAAMASAFASKGAEVVLILPRRCSSVGSDPYAYYDLPREVQIIRIWHLDTTRWGKIGFLFQYAQFAFLSGAYVLAHAQRRDVVFSREYLCCVLPLLKGLRTAWESHRGEWNAIIAMLCRRGMRIVAISQGLSRLYRAMRVPEAQIFVAPDGVDLERFGTKEGRGACRQILGLSPDARIALYAGHLYPWKGAQVLAHAAAHLPEGWEAVFVGGTDEDVRSFAASFQGSQNVRIMGRRPHQEIPTWLRAADVVVLPNTEESELSRSFTSPLKLFEYMASGTPIVASDLPSLREILDERCAVLFVPGNSKSLALAIEVAAGDGGRAERAREKVAAYSWDHRADCILSFLSL